MSEFSDMQLLAEKWLKGTITGEEKQAFEAWYNQHPDQLEWLDDPSDEPVRQRILEAIREKIVPGADVIQISRRTRFNFTLVGVR